MKLSIGIVGLPNVGKSSLFNILTKQKVNALNYPFCTIDPNIGIVPVPDERLEHLAHISQSKKIIPAVVEFVDIAGLVKGASSGAGLGNQFLTHIRETQAIIMVVRCFRNNDVIHVEGDIDPVRDIDVIDTELFLKDLETVSKRLTTIARDAKSGNTEVLLEQKLLEDIKKRLENEELLFDIRENSIIKNLNLLSAKKRLYLLNGTEKDVSQDLKEKITQLQGEYCIADLSSSESVQQSLKKLIQKAYTLLNLISFFTTGEMETRAWTIKRGACAPEAAGTIHSDFEKKFIRAEVVSYADLCASGSWQKAKQKGLIRLEGKTYCVQDGDSLIIRHG